MQDLTPWVLLAGAWRRRFNIAEPG